MKYGAKWPEYAAQWNKMAINANRTGEFNKYAQRILLHKADYLAVEDATGVPWYMVGLLHLRESDMDFSTYLGNGEPLNRRTRLVPKGRGPFPSFLAGAVDALKYDGLTNVIDWRLEKILFHCEAYNGWGYANKGLPSPYVWGGTNIQRAGKYVADGKWSSSAWDTQPGVAPILSVLMRLDSSIKPKRED